METGSISPERLYWFAARTRNGQELSVRNTFQKLGREFFIPTRLEKRERGGRAVKAEVPVISNLVFLRTTKEDACAIANGRGVPIWYMIDRTTNSMLIVPDKQMEDFKRVFEIAPDTISTDAPSLVPGDRVRIIKGELKGVEGEVIQLPNRTYVILSLGSLLFARIKVLKSHLKVLK